MAERGVSGPIAALILAGGHASRLGGADKPGITISGRSLLATVASAAREAGASRVVVIGPARPDLARSGLPGSALPSVEFTSEQPPGGGPVPAVRAGLAKLAGGSGGVVPPDRTAGGSGGVVPPDRTAGGSGGVVPPDRTAGGSGGVVPPDRTAESWLFLLAADLPFLRGPHLRTLLAAAERRASAGALLLDGQGRSQWLVSCWRTADVRSALAGYEGASLGGLLSPLRPAEVTISSEPGQAPPWLDCDTEEDVAAALALAGQPPGEEGS